MRSYETVVNLISNTTNRGGLVVRARLDRRKYPTGAGHHGPLAATRTAPLVEARRGDAWTAPEHLGRHIEEGVRPSHPRGAVRAYRDRPPAATKKVATSVNVLVIRSSPRRDIAPFT